MTDLPDPLVPRETDVRDLDSFLLNVERLMASELWVLSTGEEFKAAVGLWCRACKQNPPGSLPNDDRILAAFSGAGRRWKRVKKMALHGFVECSDGRLYSRHLATQILGRKRTGSLSPRLRQFILERDGPICAYCGSGVSEFHIDHVIPVSRGGTDDPKNLVIACAPCNLSKADKLVSEWRIENG